MAASQARQCTCMPAQTTDVGAGSVDHATAETASHKPAPSPAHQGPCCRMVRESSEPPISRVASTRPGMPSRQRSRTSPYCSNSLPDALLPQLLHLMPQSYVAENPSPRATDASEMAGNPLLPHMSGEECAPRFACALQSSAAGCGARAEGGCHHQLAMHARHGRVHTTGSTQLAGCTPFAGGRSECMGQAA